MLELIYMSHIRMKKIYNYLPLESSVNQFARTRNHNFGEIYASLVNGEYCDEYDRKSGKIKPGVVIIPHTPMSLKDGEILGIEDRDQLFDGAVVSALKARKTIFHSPVPLASFVPNDFPHSFAEFVSKNKLNLPGYSAFSIPDIKKAYKLLTKKGYVVRFKDATGSFGTKQSKIRGDKHLNEIISQLNLENLEKYGVVLEANLIGKKKKEPETLSAGWSYIGGEMYSYVGVQYIGKTNTPHTYLGTELSLVKGNVDKLAKVISSSQFSELIKQVLLLNKATAYLPDLICARFNFDFLKGKFELLDKKKQEKQKEGIYVLEQGFEPGGASGAILLAAKELVNVPQKDFASAYYKAHYGNKSDVRIPQTAHVFYEGEDVNFGKIQIWGEATD